MTSPTPIADSIGAHAAPNPSPQRRTFAAEAHHVLGDAWDAIGKFLPFLGQAAGNPQADEGIELLMTAVGLGAQARELEPALVLLRHIVATIRADHGQPAPAAGDGA